MASGEMASSSFSDQELPAGKDRVRMEASQVQVESLCNRKRTVGALAYVPKSHSQPSVVDFPVSWFA
jgi:hypothetical protein